MLTTLALLELLHGHLEELLEVVLELLELLEGGSGAPEGSSGDRGGAKDFGQAPS